MLSESVSDICMSSSELLTNLEIAEFYEWTMDKKPITKMSHTNDNS